VGPVWHGGGRGEDRLLAGCYRHSLELALEHGLASIAFPAISTGIFGYPLQRATDIAVATVRAVLSDDQTITRVVFTAFGAEVEDAYRTALAR
jgi:O-acetyl-ADP-ribose deacetylase (regulator of RNase III)